MAYLKATKQMVKPVYGGLASYQALLNAIEPTGVAFKEYGEIIKSLNNSQMLAEWQKFVAPLSSAFINFNLNKVEFQKVAKLFNAPPIK